MRIGVAQIRPVAGEIASNILAHRKLIDLAISSRVNALIFPELSLTGYEPTLAKKLAMDLDDPRLNEFQEMSDSGGLVIGVGAPLTSAHGVTISMIVFQPRVKIQVYSKRYLHDDEKDFFASGQHSIDLLLAKSKISLAICYEISIPQHAEDAFKRGATFYLASVAKSLEGIEKAAERLKWIAANYSMTVLVSNCVGPCDNFESAGRSAVWNNGGLLLAQLNDTGEGLLIYDTEKEGVLATQF